MANRLYNEDSIRDIASAIREKNGTANTYSVAEMGQAIRGIQTDNGGITPEGTIEITTNGTHDVTQYASASVNVPTEAGGITPSGDITITENGSYDVTQYANAIVNISTESDGASVSPLPSNIIIGTFTIEAETSDPVVIQHEFESAPIGVIYMLDTIASDYSSIPSGVRTAGGNMFGRNEVIAARASGYSATNVTAVNDISTSGFTLNSRGEEYPFMVGTYHWIAWT